MVYFDSLERVLIAVLSGILGLAMFDLIVSVGAVKRRMPAPVLKDASSRLANGLFVFLLVWKIWRVMEFFIDSRIDELIRNPVLLLYSPGRLTGAVAGVMAAALYLAPLGKRGRSLWAKLGGLNARQALVAVALAAICIVLCYLALSAGFDWWNARRLGAAFT